MSERAAWPAKDKIKLCPTELLQARIGQTVSHIRSLVRNQVYYLPPAAVEAFSFVKLYK